MQTIAKAGPEGGFKAVPGGSVTLGVEGAENGYDDPWGSNVEHAWTQAPGDTTVTYDTNKGATTANPVFTAPAADGTLTFMLTSPARAHAPSTSTFPPPPFPSMSGIPPDAGERNGGRRDPDADLRR